MKWEVFNSIGDIMFGRGWRHPLRTFSSRGFSLVTLLVSMVIVMGAILAFIEVLASGSLSVVLQSQKAEAILLAQEILEEMYDCDLHTIKTRDWTAWAKNNTVYGNRLKDLQVQLDFPYAYDQEKNHYAYRWGYTYEKGYVWSGFHHPEYTRSILPVGVILTWQVRNIPVSYRVDTIFSEIPRGV